MSAGRIFHIPTFKISTLMGYELIFWDGQNCFLEI
jgi:hypothetical protein